MGSWISYGLGTENQNLPGFVVLSPGGGGGPGLRSGFLPGALSGHGFDDSVTDPERMIRYLRNKQLDSRPPSAGNSTSFSSSTATTSKPFGEDEFLEGRIQAMETAFRMQSEATDAFDLRSEPAAGARANTATPPSPMAASWPAGSSSAACARFTSTTAPANRGTTTAGSTRTSAAAARTWTAPRPR